MKVEDMPAEWVKLARAVFARNTEAPPDKLPLAGWFIAREEQAMRAALAAVAPLIAAAEREKLLASGCPFDRVKNDLEPEDPCPVCGDLGTFDDDAPPSRCIARPAAIRALD